MLAGVCTEDVRAGKPVSAYGMLQSGGFDSGLSLTADAATHEHPIPIGKLSMSARTLIFATYFPAES
ncbi:hypothetical protein LIA77_06336 [Sarocladium implicatum]|nr:hypothetical protein LIA77_06336 [Sarocladium implicatum]